MKFIAPLSEAEHTTLNEAYHAHPSFRVRQRAQALLLNARGYSMAQISEWLDVQHETVSRWLKHWEAEGRVGLLDAPRSGRPPLLSEAEADQFIGYIDENPHQLKAAMARMQEETGKEASPDTFKRLLKKGVSLETLSEIGEGQTG
ncbi:MAG TPA: helix-turn-helix domain-containing protein [Thiolinea sp.]|nr:helix-turn-helix domain-containing protein [Thiolinea sp.]